VEKASNPNLEGYADKRHAIPQKPTDKEKPPEDTADHLAKMLKTEL
jgi:hypothetical protein